VYRDKIDEILPEGKREKVLGQGNAMIRSKAVNGIIGLILAIALHVWPGAIKPVHAQGSRKDDIVFNSRGIPLAGASVHICNMPATGTPCSPTAAIYSDPLLTQALANPTTTDGMGNYFFYAAPGQYEIEISGPGITTKQIPNVILPSDPANPTFSSISAAGGINAFTLSLSGNLTVNGSTSVVGNLASGTLNLTNQGTPPGAASTGTVNLYTKLADKKLYYKDETGTETGPIVAGGALTNQVNNWTAQQNFGNTSYKGPNPWYDITQFGGYIGPNYNTPTTCSISSGTSALTCASALDFVSGNGILVYGAGPATGLATPQAPTVTPLWQTGTTSYSYCIASVDYFGGVTPCGPAGTTSVGPTTFGQASYSISSRSSTNDGSTVTITTSSPHNIPTTPYHTFAYPQIEITGMSNSSCNTDATITSVPSTTTFTISQQQIPDITSCSGGNVAVRTEVELKWDNHQSLPITNYTCNSGNVAAITIPTLWTTVPGAFPSNNFTITGASDSTYVGHTFAITTWANVPTLQFNVTCNTATDTGNFGGNVNFMQGHATKAHLIYRCAGASCALPANANNYTLVGVAEGDDTYFIDKGYGVNLAYIDLGQYPANAPTSAQNQYLDTTITAGGGTTSLTLAASATTSVTSAKTWHDNVPNIYAACAAMPYYNGSIANSNGGTIYVPAPTGQALVTNEFPIMASLMGQLQWAGPTGSIYNCYSTELRVSAPFYLAGTMEWNGNIIGIPGGHACVATAYGGGAGLPCFGGPAYPLFHFEPFLQGEQNLTNMEIIPGQPYQVGLLWDVEPAGNGTVGFWMNNVHADGIDSAYPVVVKAGFGWFWKNGGWTSNQTEYAGGRGLFITTECSGSVYQSTNLTQLPYIFRTEDTYNFGTAEVDDCGTGVNFAGDYTIKYPLSENIRGTAWKFNSIAGIHDFRIDDEAVADNTGPGGPTFDFTNTHGGAEIVNPLCAGPLVEVLPTGSYLFKFVSHYGKACGLIGIDATYDPTAVYTYDALQIPTEYKANSTVQLLGTNGKVVAGQLANPASAPNVTVSTSACGGGFPSAGTYTYVVAVWDAVGGETLLSPVSSATVLNGSNCPVINQPTLPVGSVYWSAYAYTGPVTGSIYDLVHGVSGCGPSRTLVQYNQIVDQVSYKCGSAPNFNTTSQQAMFQNGFYGNVIASTEGTEGQCFSSASPAVCGALIDGFVTIPAGSSSVVVDTTAVTANSVISLTFDVTQSSNLGVTCNTTAQAPYISARTAGTSFSISVPSNFSTNPGCIGFHIRN
jgi:hypothetical protein